MLKNFVKLFLIAVIASSFFIVPVHAAKTIDDATSILKDVVKQTGHTSTNIPTDLPGAVGFWIKIALSVVGVAFFVLMVYAGITWMLAQGEEEKIKTAKSTIIMAVIGLFIVIAGYAITNFIVTNVIGGQASNPMTQIEEQE